MKPPVRRPRDPTFLHLAGFAAVGGLGAIGTSLYAVAKTIHSGHPTAYFFFSLWGIAALCGAAANVAVYFQSGDPPEKPPRGGKRAVAPIDLDARRAASSYEGSERRAA